MSTGRQILGQVRRDLERTANLLVEPSMTSDHNRRLVVEPRSVAWFGNAVTAHVIGRNQNADRRSGSGLPISRNYN